MGHGGGQHEDLNRSSSDVFCSIPAPIFVISCHVNILCIPGPKIKDSQLLIYFCEIVFYDYSWSF